MSAPESLLSSIYSNFSPPTPTGTPSSTTLCLFSISSSISCIAWESFSRPALSAKECNTRRRVALSGGGPTDSTWWKRPFLVSAASMQKSRFVAANTTTPQPFPSPPPPTPSISVRKVASNLPSTDTTTHFIRDMYVCMYVQYIRTKVNLYY